MGYSWALDGLSNFFIRRKNYFVNAHLQIAHVEDLLEDAKSPAEKRSAVDQLTDPNAEWPFAMAERLMADLALREAIR